MDVVEERMGVEEAMAFMKERAKALGLDPNKKEIYLSCTPSGQWIYVVTRYGYRKAAAKQPDYLNHVVYPIYDNTRIEIADNKVSVSISGDMCNITGAIGFLYKQGMPGFFCYQSTLSDYDGLISEGAFWKSMPHTMIMKVCETTLIRMAYPDLFQDTYSEEEFVEEKKAPRKDLIRSIRERLEEARPFLSPTVSLDNMDISELMEIKRKIDESKA